jgi:hypothetical protein
MNSNICPVCGADGYHHDSGWQNGEPIEPATEWCDRCGFNYSQSFVTPYLACVKKARIVYKSKLKFRQSGKA